MKMAVLGPKGTFSDKAYIEYNKYISEKKGPDYDFEPVYCSTIDEVFERVFPSGNSEGDCEYGIVPIENTLDGYVLRTLDLLHEKEVKIVDENMVPVQFSLVGNVNSLDEIKKLYVQFKANGQCRAFINSLKNVDIVTTESNMESYYRIADHEGEAAIVPSHIAANEADRFVVDNVTDSDSNHTRFVVFKKGIFSVSESCKARLAEENAKSDGMKVRVPVYIIPKTDRPGILYEILKEFYEDNINLISIMSRPTKQEMGTYNFYIEIDGLFDRIDIILSALKKIKENNEIKILGIYSE